MSRIAVIGAGFSGLSAAAYLAQTGHEVHVFEKNNSPGGRARQLKTGTGYCFDMGPSWYWMPDVFENFFADFGYAVSDFYKLDLLDPAFEMVFENNQQLVIPSEFEELCTLFESIESGSAGRLRNFMEDAKVKYRVSMDKIVHLPGLSILEFADRDILAMLMRADLFRPFEKHLKKYFTDPKLKSLMEFPILFLGGTAKNIPALYSLMNYAGLKLGTWYPKGGFGKVVDAFVEVARKSGVRFHFNAPVERIICQDTLARGIFYNNNEMQFDGVIATGDYHHIESQLLQRSYRNYSEAYWERRKLAPSCLIFYIGINKKIDRLKHHTLFFDECADQHAEEIYEQPRWPTKPQFYVCCPSKSDDSVAPQGHENLFFLMPVAPGLDDTDATREKYLEIMIKRLETHIGSGITGAIDYKKSYSVSDFVFDYNSYKGNAYGLSNTLNQTAILKPKIRNRKLRNLFYAGQFTVPGPGVPPAIISGKIVAGQMLKLLNRKEYESTI